VAEDSPSCLPWLLVALPSNWSELFIGRSVFVFSFFGKFLLLLLLFCQAAICCLLAVSALTPMAQMKPSSSRPTAMTILRWSLPAAASLE
jgi:hypothetical protein